MLFARVLARLIRFGSLTLADATGHCRTFGGPPIEGVAPVAIKVHTRLSDWRLALRPTLAVGEAYTDGTLSIEQGSLYDFLALASHNLDRVAGTPLARLGEHLAFPLRWVQQHNPVLRAHRNAAHHYDLSAEFYDLFLDADRQYSCAYFARPDMGLEQAQAAKTRHIAAKLLLAPGQRVLDIGCGWGGLALALARAAEVEVLGITLSSEQLAAARRRAAEAGLADRVRFELSDYRRVRGGFDRIVSVGMFEHVGCRHYGEFFAAVRDLLSPTGVMLLHAIGRYDGPGVTNPWLRKHIFPGGYSPALSEVLPAVEGNRLHVTDIEILRRHYADTLREWRRRFQANRVPAARLYGERFCRKWEFYLAGAEATFRHQGHMVFQMQLAKAPEAVPITRDYIGEAEQRLA